MHGVRGVTKTRSGRFSTQIQYKGTCYRLGTYDTLEEAASARKNADDAFRPEPERIMGDASAALKKLQEKLAVNKEDS